MKNDFVDIEHESYCLEQKSEQIVVVCASDDNYVMPLSVTIRSALENLAKDRRILLFVFDGSIKDTNKRRFLSSLDLERCEVRWIPKPDTLINGDLFPASITSSDPFVRHITIAAWYRLIISEVLPQSFKKAIYLDCDLVVNADLGKLWDIDIEDNYLLAVARLESFGDQTVPCFLKNWRELGFSENDKYFNSGVLVFNLEKWRYDHMSSRCFDYVRQNQEYIRWGDQDVLNAIVAGHWGELDPKWNCMNPPSMSKEEIDNSFILHFCSGGLKPWHVIESYPACETFYTYLRLTSWSGYRQTISQRIWRKLKRKVKQFLST
jgi:lipopolysaccharide biosynthesis glycosyltransferase